MSSAKEQLKQQVKRKRTAVQTDAKKSNYAKHRKKERSSASIAVPKEKPRSTARKLLPGCVDALRAMSALSQELKQRVRHNAYTVSIEMMSDHWALTVRGVDPGIEWYMDHPVHYIESSLYKSI